MCTHSWYEEVGKEMRSQTVDDLASWTKAFARFLEVRVYMPSMGKQYIGLDVGMRFLYLSKGEWVSLKRLNVELLYDQQFHN